MYNDHCLGYRHDYFKFYQFPNINSFTHHLLFFSREATSETYGPGSLSHIIFLRDLFYLPFIFRSIKPKIQKHLATIYFIWRSIYQYLQLSPAHMPISSDATRKGLTAPFTRRLRVFVICVQVMFMLCCLVLLLV